MSRWVTIAGMFRFFETFSIVYFLPSFFQKVYPLNKTEFGLYASVILALCGLLSSLIGGLISDKFEKKSRMTKSLICIVGALIGLPAIAVCTLTTNNFYISIIFMALKYLVAESWMPPALTMMQATVKPEDQGNIVSASLFYLVVTGCFSTVLLGYVSNLLGAASNPIIYGKLIFIWSLIGYLGCIPCFWISGKLYQKFIQ